MKEFEQMEREYPILSTKPAFYFSWSLTAFVAKLKKILQGKI